MRLGRVTYGKRSDCFSGGVSFSWAGTKPKPTEHGDYLESHMIGDETVPGENRK